MCWVIIIQLNLLFKDKKDFILGHYFINKLLYYIS